MKLADMVFGGIPDLASAAPGIQAITTMPDVFGGTSVRGPLGEVLASVTPNIFGGNTVKDSVGNVLQSSHESIPGVQTYLGGDGSYLGQSHSNIFGGDTLIGDNGAFIGSTQANIFGGEDLMGVTGNPLLSSHESIFGGLDITGDLFAAPTMDSFDLVTNSGLFDVMGGIPIEETAFSSVMDYLEGGADFFLGMMDFI